MANENTPLFALPSLEQYQQAMKAQDAEGMNLLQRRALDSSYDFARQLGYKSSEEKRIQRANEIMAQAEATPSDSSDPLEQQMAVLTKAAMGFNQAGMTDYVRQIAPELARLKNQLLEQKKLVAEADASKASTAEKKLDTLYKFATFQSRVEEAQANAEAAGLGEETWFNKEGDLLSVNSKNKADVAKAKAMGYTKYVTGMGTTGELGAKTPTQVGAQIVDFEKAATDATVLDNQLTDALQLLKQNPQAATVSGDVAGQLLTIKQNMEALNAANGIDIKTTEEGDSVSTIVDKSLPRANAQLKGMIIGLMYARARVLDPGGRLSNQDVEAQAKQFSTYTPQQLVDSLSRLRLENRATLRVKASGLGVDKATNKHLAVYEDALTQNNLRIAGDGQEDLTKISDEELQRRINGM